MFIYALHVLQSVVWALIIPVYDTYRHICAISWWDLGTYSSLLHWFRGWM